MTTREDSGRGGFTLLETAIATALLVVAFGSLMLFTGRGAGALGESTSQADLDAHLRRTVARIGEELLPSGLGVITPPALAPTGSASLTYRKSAGPVNGVNTWGTAARFAFAYETGELDDGLDNNGNGLADEGVVEWTINVGQADEQTVVLCHGVRELGRNEQDNDLDDDGDGLVDEPGLVFEREGNVVVRLELTLERLSAERRFTVRSLETVLQPRN